MGFPMDKSLETYKLIHYSEEVSKARQEKRPIVALESTIITHGMPFPDNYYIAIEAERIARKKGCTPATIAIIDGKIRIGLSDEEKHLLARSQINIRRAFEREARSIQSSSEETRPF